MNALLFSVQTQIGELLSVFDESIKPFSSQLKTIIPEFCETVVSAFKELG